MLGAFLGHGSVMAGGQPVYPSGAGVVFLERWPGVGGKAANALVKRRCDRTGYTWKTPWRSHFSHVARNARGSWPRTGDVRMRWGNKAEQQNGSACCFAMSLSNFSDRTWTLL